MTGASQTDVNRPETAIGTLLHRAAARLHAAGLQAPQREARLLFAAASGLPPTAILGWPERMLAPGAIETFNGFLDRRSGHEPLSRIVGHRAFWTLELAIGSATLDPRPDTETVVDAALACIGDPHKPLGILDLGTGTGAILLALLSECPAAWGVGVDRSPEAAHIAAKNAQTNGLADQACFLAGDWGAALCGTFDLIVSNPPYIESADIPFLSPEVRDHDPLLALDGGADGLDAYRKIIPALPDLLTPGGHVIVEIGQGQAPVVADLFQHAGLVVIEQRADIAGIIRAVTAIQQ